MAGTFPETRNLSPEDATQAWLATIPADVRARSDAYTEGGYWLVLWGLIIAAAVTWIIMRSGWLVKVRDWANKSTPKPKWASVAVAAALLMMSWVIGMPWTVYAEWWREKSYGLSKQPFGDWFGQEVISLLVSLALIIVPVMLLYIGIRRSPRRWWLWGGGFSAVMILFLLLIALVFIEPLFNDYKPFPAGPVRDEIVRLAKIDGVPTDKIFVYDGSRQRDVVTANVSGIMDSARIAVSDVALKETSLSEVRGVVGHEIGHYVLRHSYRGAFFFAGLVMLGLFAVHLLFTRFVKLFGAEHQITSIADPAGLPVLSFVVTLVLTLATPLVNTYTRLGEREADDYSLRVARDPDGLSSALIKTVEYRKASPGPVAEFIFHSHPSVEKRVRNAMAWKAKNRTE
jgi:STE24 endopeptidase